MLNFLNKQELVVPTADVATNAFVMDVVVNKTDAAAAGAVSATESLMAYSKQNVTNTEAATVALTTIDGMHDVPTQNLATNAIMSQVIGNKTDTLIGTSLYSQTVNILTNILTILNNTGALVASNIKTLTGTGDTKISLFSVTGAVRVHEIYGVVQTVADFETTVFQKVGLVLYEATPTTVEITDIGVGVDGSGAVAGSFFIRTAVDGSAQPLTFLPASVCAKVETTFEGGGYGLVLVQRTANDTFVQVEFTGAAATKLNMQWFVRYTPLTTGATIIPTV